MASLSWLSICETWKIVIANILQFYTRTYGAHLYPVNVSLQVAKRRGFPAVQPDTWRIRPSQFAEEWFRHLHFRKVNLENISNKSLIDSIISIKWVFYTKITVFIINWKNYIRQIRTSMKFSNCAAFAEFVYLFSNQALNSNDRLLHRLLKESSQCAAESITLAYSNSRLTLWRLDSFTTCRKRLIYSVLPSVRRR